MPIGRPYSLATNVATKVVTKTATAGQTSFTVDGGYRIGEIEVYRNGVRLVNAKDYTATNASTVILVDGATVGDSVSFHVFDSFNVANTIKPNESEQTINGNLTITGNLVSSGGINTSSNIGFGTTRPDSIARVNNTTILNAGIITAYQFYGDLAGDVTSSGAITISDTTASTSTSTGALIVSGGVGIAKSLTVGEGISIAGTITYNDVTNVDSVGIITAGKGFRATTGGAVITAGNVKVTAGIASVGAGVTISSDFIHLTDNSKIQLGIASDLTIQHNATNSVINNATNQLRIAGDDLRLMNKDEDETYATFANDGAATLYYDNSKIIETVSSGASVYGALKLQNGLLRENVNRNTSAAANAATALNLDNGMVHWFTTNLGAANVKMNVVSGAGINTDLAIGDMISVTIMTAVNSTSNFIEQVRVDGVEASAGVTTYWTGGSAPTNGGGSGVDTYAFNIVKTASARYDMIANQVKGS